MRFIRLCFICVAVITMSAIASEPFADVTEAVGLEGLAGGAAAWGDYNNDGWTDLYVSGQLWRNEGGKRFTRIKADAPAGPGARGDYDNDGWLDLFSWSGGRLFRNERGERFTPVSDAFPELPMKVPMGAACGDYNGDGFFDLYVTG